MHIKHFSSFEQRVADPLRPGRSVPTRRLRDSGNSSLTHEGETYEPDANGWIEVPHDIGRRLCRFRQNGSGFYEPGEVADLVRIGSLDEPDEPVREKPRPKSAKAAE